MPVADPVKDGHNTPPMSAQRKRRRFLNRRNAVITGIALGIAIVALVIIGFLAYRLGFVDNYVASQIKNTFSKYGIRAEIRTFHTTLPPNAVEMQGIELYDATSGEKLGKIDRLLATIRVRDLYALNLSREIELQDLKIEGLEVWASFDAEGKSNFRNIHVPPPEPNKRILFAYSAAHIELKSSLIHYGDAQHSLSGEGRNLQATIDPDLPNTLSNPNAAGQSAMNRVHFSLTNSTFVYDGRPVNNIDLDLQGRVNETRAEIQKLVLKSPVAEATLNGTMDDWRKLRYQMNITSTVDLTQFSEVLKAGATLRGSGNFVGTVSGEGDQYKVQGAIKSDALAADNIRLQGLNLTATGSGKGKGYEANGRAVADLLNAGDFQLNAVQISGKVMGTGSDFRWVGELRAAAEKSYGAATIVGLILHDAQAEMKDGALTASASQFTASGLTASGVRVTGINAANLRLRNEDKSFHGSIASVKAAEVIAPDTHVKGVTANGIDFKATPAGTSVNIKDVLVGGVSTRGAEISSFNIAGVRLSVHAGKIEGSTADINPGSIKLKDGSLENVKLAKPVFVVEPSGRYRASADLSIGGGVLGQMKMGQARAAVVATSSELQVNDFTADVFGGQTHGNAKISLTKSGVSQVVAELQGLDVAAPLTMLSGTAVPLSGTATGKIDLKFPALDFQKASGTISTQFTAGTVATGSERTPISGEVALQANNGLFQIQRVDLQTAASHLKATGQFSFAGDSNLQVDFNSTDAGEIQRVAISSGLLPSVEEQMNQNGVELAGQLVFSGNVRGQLSAPDFDGRVSLGSLLINGNDVGALSASLIANQTELRIADGKLAEKDGGGIQFSLNAPRTGENNISVDVTLDRANARSLLAALPKTGHTGMSLQDIDSKVSGHIAISGIPKAMSGSADLSLGAGRIAGEPFESIVARATFSGADVTLENVDARFDAGHLILNGKFNTETHLADLNLTGHGLQLGRLAVLAGKPDVKNVSGYAELTAHVSGNILEKDFSSYQVTFDAEGHEVAVNGRAIGTLTLVGRTENKQLNISFTTGVFGPPQTVNARIDLSNDQLPATIDATFNGADLTRLLAIAAPNAGMKLTGRATGVIKAKGNLLDEDGYFSLAGLQGTADFSELGFRVEDIALAAVAPFSVRLTANQVIFDRTQFTGNGTNLSLDGAIAIAEGGKQSLSVNGRLNLRVVNGFSPDFFASGTGDVAMRVAGTFDQPSIIGTASLSGASVAVLIANDRWQISNIHSVLRFNANQAQIESFAGTLGGGHLSISGGALLDGIDVTRFTLNLHGDNISAPFPEDFTSTLDADIEIKGDSREQLVSGSVELRRTEYTKDIELANLINRREQSIEEGGEIALVRTARFAGLRVEGRNALVVKNNLADLVGSVSLQINGPVKNPVISGRITATSGTLNFRNDRYEITRAFIDLPEKRDADPILNIEGESQIRGYRVIVGLTGPLSQPQAAVRSEPALPQADVVSLITTGTLTTGDTSTSGLSRTGIGTATSLLTDVLINEPAQRATSKLFGLNRFEISPVLGGAGVNPGARLTVGKRISKELSVAYSTNVTADPNQILTLEYRVSDRLSFVAQYEQASTRQLSSRNSSFNFEIRFRKRF